MKPLFKHICYQSFSRNRLLRMQLHDGHAGEIADETFPWVLVPFTDDESVDFQRNSPLDTAEGFTGVFTCRPLQDKKCSKMNKRNAPEPQALSNPAYLAFIETAESYSFYLDYIDIGDGTLAKTKFGRVPWFEEGYYYTNVIRLF